MPKRTKKVVKRRVAVAKTAKKRGLPKSYVKARARTKPRSGG